MSRFESWRGPLILLAGLVVALPRTVRGAGPGPVEVAPIGPFEVRLAFERPPALDPKALVGRSIVFDEEEARPAEPDRRGRLRIAAVSAEDDGATLRLTTDPHPRAGRYTLPLDGAPVVYGVGGVEAAWRPDGAAADAPPAWSGTWPGFDAATLKASTPAARRARGLLETPGTLTLTALVALPEGPQTLRLTANRPVTATLDGLEPAPPEEGAKPDAPVAFEVESTGQPSLLSLTVPTGPGRPAPAVALSIQGGDDREPRPLPPGALTLPWVPPAPPPAGAPANVPDLSGGDPAKGELVFRGAEAKCASCHKARGQGGEVGPDLATLAGRDRADVYRDIAEPSARIHPGYVAYTVATKDGRILAGTVRAEGADAIRVTDNEAKATVVPRAEIEDVRPSATSAMPVGLAGAIGEAALKDLIAFLTAPARR